VKFAEFEDFTINLKNLQLGLEGFESAPIVPVMENNTVVPEFLVDLLNARSPSGYETEAQAVVDKYVQPKADTYEKDALGNRIATVKGSGGPTLMMTGHMDELGLIITYVDDKGFLYFNTVGGIDLTTISGRRVSILTRDGVVKGVTGRRAIHLLNAEERKKVPEMHNLWIDIGAKSKKDALSRVRIGDVAVYDQAFELMNGSVGIARAFDDKAGCYVVCETLRRLADDRDDLQATIVSVGTSQEEIGCRGARAVAGGVKADFAIAVDVGHATDHPECDNRRFGEFKMGGGPIITRGANINPVMFNALVEVAEKNKIPFQIEADPRPTGTDGRELQMAPGGLATAVVSIPLRYMHTPSEIVDLQDIENTVRLLVAYAKSLKPGDSGNW
jgi:endoglucanase